MDVSVIIVTYNTLHMTDECISSVISKTFCVDYEIILIDNASSDGSKDFFKNDTRVHYVYNDKNLGFGAANNIGMKMARGKYLFLLNSDTILINNAIKEFFDYAEKESGNVCMGCYLVDRYGKINSPAFFFPRFTIRDFIKDKIHHSDYAYDTTKVMDVQCVCGADLFFNRAIIDEVGGFDEQIFMYGEEGELQYRMMQHKVRRFLIPGPQIVHFGGGSQQSNLNYRPGASNSYRYKSHFVIIKKHMSTATYLIARVYYAFNITLRYLPKALFVDKVYFNPIKQVLQ